jgi:hypothetical protein
MKRSIASSLALLFLEVPPCRLNTTRTWSCRRCAPTALVGQINTAVGAEDFYTSALRLMDLAANFRP